MVVKTEYVCEPGTHSQQPLDVRGYTDDCSLHTDSTDRATDDSDEGHQSSVVSLVSETDSLVSLPASVPDTTHCEPLHIVWPHRWYICCLLSATSLSTLHWRATRLVEAMP